MKNVVTLFAAAMLLLGGGNIHAQESMRIGKQNITVKGGLMTPEALWAMGRIGGYEASPDGKRIIYNVGYYSVKANKSHHVLYVKNQKIGVVQHCNSNSESLFHTE